MDKSTAKFTQKSFGVVSMFRVSYQSGVLKKPPLWGTAVLLTERDVLVESPLSHFRDSSPKGEPLMYVMTRAL